MLKLYLHNSRSVTSFHIKIRYRFNFNHSMLKNLFVQTVRFVMWVKTQGNSSAESINTYRETLIPTPVNIYNDHVYVTVVQ